MNIGDIFFSDGCSWGTNYLNIAAGGKFAYSELPFNTSDTGFTASMAFRAYKSTNTTTSIVRPLVCQATLLDASGEKDRFFIGVRGNTTFRIRARAADGTGTEIIGPSFVEGFKVIDLVIEPTVMSLYIDGVIYSSVNWTWENIESDLRVALAGLSSVDGATSVSNSHQLRVFALNLYNRPLSSAEIEQNYNTYVERFNS